MIRQWCARMNKTFDSFASQRIMRSHFSWLTYENLYVHYIVFTALNIKHMHTHSRNWAMFSANCASSWLCVCRGVIFSYNYLLVTHFCLHMYIHIHISWMLTLPSAYCFFLINSLNRYAHKRDLDFTISKVCMYVCAYV